MGIEKLIIKKKKTIGLGLSLILAMFIAVVAISEVSLISKVQDTVALFRASPPKLLIIRSGSMSPGIPVGGAIAVAPSKTYGEGDVISFKTDTDLTVTHRISEVVTDEFGALGYVTKGDANTGEDPKVIPHEKVIGGVVWTLPYVGYLLSSLKTKKGFSLFILVPAFIIILFELLDILRETNNILLKEKKRKRRHWAFSLKNLLILPLLLLPFSYFHTSNAMFSDTEIAGVVLSTDIWGDPTPTPGQWDKSSLYFDEEFACQVNCEEVVARVCNGEDSEDMMETVVWELYWAETGNPKDGSVIADGVVEALSSGECQEISYARDEIGGNYMFKSYQIPGHPGTGELWSEEGSTEGCEVEQVVDELEVDELMADEPEVDETSTEIISEELEPTVLEETPETIENVD